MTTLDDKILGEKLQYYYSSSEDEGSDNEDEDGENKTIRDANPNEPEIDYSADGSAVNTGSWQTHHILSYVIYNVFRALLLFTARYIQYVQR